MYWGREALTEELGQTFKRSKARRHGVQLEAATSPRSSQS
jgi:hypothetical protein